MPENNPQKTRNHAQFIVGDVTMNYDPKGRFTIPREMCPESVYYFQEGKDSSVEVYPESKFAIIAGFVMGTGGVYSPDRRKFFAETDFARKDKVSRVLTPKRMRPVLGFEEEETGLVRLTGNGDHIIVTRVRTETTENP